MKTVLVAMLLATIVLSASLWLGSHFSERDQNEIAHYRAISADTNSRIRNVEERQTSGLKIAQDTNARLIEKCSK